MAKILPQNRDKDCPTPRILLEIFRRSLRLLIRRTNPPRCHRIWRVAVLFSRASPPRGERIHPRSGNGAMGRSFLNENAPATDGASFGCSENVADLVHALTAEDSAARATAATKGLGESGAVAVAAACPTHSLGVFPWRIGNLLAVILRPGRADIRYPARMVERGNWHPLGKPWRPILIVVVEVTLPPEIP